MSAIVFLALAASASAVRESANPVAKVVRLLKDMQDQLTSEKKADEELYDKLSCWCKSNGAGKDAAVETATQRVSDLANQIKALSAKASELETSITQLNGEVASNQQALATASEMRAKDHAAFVADDKDMTLSIGSLKHAVVALSKHQNFMQVSVKTTVRRILKATPDELLAQILNPRSRAALGAFVQENGQAQPYESQGGEIVGVLKQMKENFESNLGQAKADEAKAHAEFTALKEAKSDEIAAGEQLAKDKTAQLARAKQDHAQATEDREDTSSALAADQAFLVDMKQRCASADADWVERSKSSALEIQAVGEAIAVLTADDARDNFGKTLGFLQLSSKRRHVSKGQLAREQASRLLLNQARKTGNLALAQIAAHVHSDAFAKVEEALTGMITDLTKENADEVKHKDYCRKEFHQNDMEQLKAKRSVKELDTALDNFASKIDTLQDEISALKAELAQMQVDTQRANENRVQGNQEFQKTIADQRATQAILKKALDRLGKFYNDQFLQLSAKSKAQQEPMPQGFGEYKANSGAGSVMTMLGNIIQDAKDMEQEATKSEQDAQDAYEEFLKTSDASTKAAQRSVTNKAENTAKAESAKVSAEADKADAEADLESLARYAAELHSTCDFVLQNFDARQASRATEMESLNSALQSIKGA